MIGAKQVFKKYGRKRDSQVVALNDIEFTVARGEHVAIVGRSGSGKTTLLNLLAGLDRPTSGFLEVDNTQLAKMSRSAMATYRCRSVGVVFQAFQLIPQRTAFQNIELPMIVGGSPRAMRQKNVNDLLNRVGLAGRANHHPYQLSGGEQQRVAIARALANRPPLILADEPTGNLDSSNAQQIMELLMKICSESDSTFVLVTHDKQLARRYGNRIFEMTDGAIAENG